MLQLRCFGQIAIVDDSGEERSLRSRKHLGLLLYLLAHRRTTHPREDLADLLWDGAGPKERHSLSQALYDIRTKAPELLEVSTASVRVLPGCMAYEAETFERAVETGDHETALELYRGEFAPELMSLGVAMFDRWVDGERERCRVLASLALRNAQRAAEERGDWDRMCLASLRLVRLNEFDEEAHCALMRGLWMKGDPASALRHYRALDEELKSGWREAAELAGRLRDSGAVREVLTVPRSPRQLHGRDREFQMLRTALCEKTRGRLILLAGTRGSGKTALLTELVRLLEAQGVDVYWQHPPGDVRSEASDGQQIRVLDPGPSDLLGAFEGLQAIRPKVTLLVSTTDCIAAEEAKRRYDVGSLVHLAPLGIRATCDLLRARCRDLPLTRLEGLARLSGGLPLLADALAEASSGNQGDESDDALGERVLDDSSLLRSVVYSLLDDLDTDELAAAQALTVLSPETRLFFDRLGAWDDLKIGLRGLERRSWLIRRESVPSLAYPIVAIGLLRRMDCGAAARIRSAAAAKLESRSPAETHAAALEVARTGRNTRAAELAESAQTRALIDGDAVVATEAADLGIRVATSVVNRFRLGLIAAEAELARGRPWRAERLARQFVDVAPDLEAGLRTRLLLVRALHEDGQLTQALVEAAEADRLLPLVGDPDLAVLARIEFADARMALAASLNDVPRTQEAASELETCLRGVEALGARNSIIWAHAIRSLFSFRLRTEGPSGGEDVIRRQGERLTTGMGGGLSLLDFFRSAVESRAGRVRNSAAICQQILERHSRDPQLLTSAVRNNLAVAMIELGDFAGAFAELKIVQAEDSELALPVHTQIPPLLNLAQAAWFSGDLAQGYRFATQAAALAAEASHRQEEGIAVSLAGLMCLERGDMRNVCALRERLKGIAGVLDSPREDQFYVHWFTCRSGSGAVALNRLVDVARSLRQYDPLAASKLMVVAMSVLGSSRAPEGFSDAVAHLRRSGAGWFVRRLIVPGEL